VARGNGADGIAVEHDGTVSVRPNVGVEVFVRRATLLGVIPAVWGGDAFMLKSPQKTVLGSREKDAVPWWARRRVFTVRSLRRALARGRNEKTCLIARSRRRYRQCHRAARGPQAGRPTLHPDPATPRGAYAIHAAPPPTGAPPARAPGDRAPNRISRNERRSSPPCAGLPIYEVLTDWVPEDQPAMPRSSPGRQQGSLGESYCNYPNGKGRASNGGVAGMPVVDILQTLHDLQERMRKPGASAQGERQQMIECAKRMDAEEDRSRRPLLLLHAGGRSGSGGRGRRWIHKTRSEGSISSREKGGGMDRSA